ncbi:MAG: hypothetical protein U9Q70_01195, partial [Chloroflexota bacterium]|nr:hypothetical protein [Chloroflexota bacterium]
GVVSGTQLVITPGSFTVAAGGSQEVNVQIELDVVPGVYQGGLVLTSDNGGTHRTLEVEFHNLYLPLILRNH